MDYSFPGILQIAGQEGMEGYIPITAQNNMQGYGDYMTQLTNNNGKGGQGADYQFNDPSFDAYQAEQMKAKQAEQEKRTAIASIQSQISVLEQRIASNTNKLKAMLKGNDVADELASLEAGKIGFRFNRQMNNDPTSLFRWAKQNEDSRNKFNQQIKMQREQLGLNALRTSNEIANNIAQINETPLSENADMLEQQINQMIRSKYELKTKGATPEQLNAIDNKINEAKLRMNGVTPIDNGGTPINNGANGTNQDKSIAEINTILKKQNPTVSELKRAEQLFSNNVKNTKYNNLLTEIRNKLEIAQKQAKDRAYNKDFEAWATARDYTKADIEKNKDILMDIYKQEHSR